jgi:hypothetical protein
MEPLKASHDKVMMGEVERREQACEEAREEIIERAEIQSAMANAIYTAEEGTRFYDRHGRKPKASSIV